MWYPKVTQCTADKAGKMWFGLKQCRSLSIQQAWNKTFCLRSSARASALLSEAHGITLRGVISSTALSMWKATASLFTLPHFRLPRTEEAGKMKQKQGAPGGKDTAVQSSFYKPVTCPSLIQHNPPEATNIDKRFKRHVVWKGLFSLGRSQADTSHMVISLLVLPYGEDISCITFSKRTERR